jgi:hypothetical protein
MPRLTNSIKTKDKIIGNFLSRDISTVRSAQMCAHLDFLLVEIVSLKEMAPSRGFMHPSHSGGGAYFKIEAQHYILRIP